MDNLNVDYDMYKSPLVWKAVSIRFYPPKGLQWGPFWFFPFYCGLRRVFDTFKITTFRRPFWNPENVLSPEGTLQSRAQWGPFWFFPFNCGLRRVFDTFKILTFRPPFWNSENVLSRKGLSAKQSPMGCNLILSILRCSEKGIWHFQNHHFQAAFLKSGKSFIPPRDSA